MRIENLLSDPDLGAVEFSVVRKTWTTEDGVPVMTDLEEIFTHGILHPADPARLDLLPEESRHEYEIPDQYSSSAAFFRNAQ